MLPDTKCDPYQAILAAGSLREQAGSLVNTAEVYEGAARMQLGLGDTELNSQTVVPGTVMCVAYGGNADGKIERVPFKALQSSKIPLVAAGSAAKVAMYEPAMLIQLAQFYPGALLVPAGERMRMYHEMATMIDGENYSPLAVAITKLIVNAVGFNTEVAFGTIKKLKAAAASNEVVEFDSPMLLKLGS